MGFPAAAGDRSFLRMTTVFCKSQVVCIVGGRWPAGSDDLACKPRASDHLGLHREHTDPSQ